MATNVMTGQNRELIAHDFSLAERLILRRFHPRSVFIDTVGLVWFTFYFWSHDWQAALAVAVITRLVAFLSVMNINTDLFAETVLGKVALLHLNPFNFIIQLTGTIILLVGLWDHTTEVILGGVSVILLGHVFGWAKVDPGLVDIDG